MNIWSQGIKHDRHEKIEKIEEKSKKAMVRETRVTQRERERDGSGQGGENTMKSVRIGENRFEIS